MFGVSLLLWGSWFMQGLGDSDCFYNNPNPVSKLACGKAIDAISWKRNLSFGLAAMGVLVCSVAYYGNRHAFQDGEHRA